MTRRSSALKAGWGSERAIASTPRMRPSRVRTGQERNEEVLYQSHSRSALSGVEALEQAVVQADGARPVLDPLDPHGAAGLDRRLGHARALGLVGAVEHRHERVADGVGGEPRRGGPDVRVRRVDDQEGHAGDVEQPPHLGDDLLERPPQPGLRPRGVLDAALLHHARQH